MPSPFPGMDPYLEEPGLWQSFHAAMAAAIMGQIQPRLGERYWISLEVRIYLESDSGQRAQIVPDVSVATGERREPHRHQLAAAASGGVAVLLPMPQEVREHYLEVHDTGNGMLVSVIEILSPSNKRTGEGRDAYLQKRNRVLSTWTNLVEIDLLRDGQRMPMNHGPSHYDYGVLVHCGRHLASTLYPVGVRDPLPSIGIPLLEGDEDVPLPLARAFEEAFERGTFARRINYAAHPQPLLDPDDAEWADALLREKGLR